MKLYLRRPVPIKFKISSPFGERELFKKVEMHNGIDFACPQDTPIVACFDGKIERSGWQDYLDRKRGFGLRVMERIKYDGDIYFLFYGHCSELMVTEGDDVKEGDIIALSGNTGKTTGPHLHLGCRKMDTKEYFDMSFYEEKGVI